MRRDIRALLRSPRNVVRTTYSGTGLLTRAPALSRLPVPFPDRSIQWVRSWQSGATRSTCLLNGGAAANAHTVAGQWRHFTAFPYIPGIFAMVVASRRHALAVISAFPECITAERHKPLHFFVTRQAVQRWTYYAAYRRCRYGALSPSRSGPVRIPPLPQDYVTCLWAQHGSPPAGARPRFELKDKSPVHHQEHLVFVIMHMPGQFAFHLGHFDVLFIHSPHHTWRPVVLQPIQLPPQIDRFHLPTPSRGTDRGYPAIFLRD
jgi:hypothetical protein